MEGGAHVAEVEVTNFSVQPIRSAPVPLGIDGRNVCKGNLAARVPRLFPTENGFINSAWFL